MRQVLAYSFQVYDKGDGQGGWTRDMAWKPPHDSLHRNQVKASLYPVHSLIKLSSPPYFSH